MVACVGLQRDSVRADTDEGKGEKKEHTDLRWTRRVDANECKKKKKKKEKN